MSPIYSADQDVHVNGLSLYSRMGSLELFSRNAAP